MINYDQNTLFGKKVISSISFDEREIITDILFLHARGKQITCDPTFSLGIFYNDGAIPYPQYKFDKFPQLPDVKEATSDNLPLENESCEVILFDPPFIIGGATYNEAEEGSCIIAKRFYQFTSFDELKQMYSGSLKEFSRILKDDGIVIFKCQDCVSGGKQYFSHVWVMNEAVKMGFYPKDLFILLAKNRLTDGREQHHARKFHCFYWIFSKNKFKNYYE